MFISIKMSFSNKYWHMRDVRCISDAYMNDYSVRRPYSTHFYRVNIVQCNFIYTKSIHQGRPACIWIEAYLDYIIHSFASGSDWNATQLKNEKHSFVANEESIEFQSIGVVKATLDFRALFDSWRWQLTSDINRSYY